MSKYTEAWTAGLVGLKKELELTMEKVFEIYIRTTPERLWEAITDPDTRRRFHFGNRVESDWTPGSPYVVTNPHRRRSAHRGREPRGRPAAPAGAEHARRVGRGGRRAGTSRVTWEIEPVGDSCRLTVTHDQLPEDAREELYGGWPMILSGLKTWLETGEELTTPGSLMYKGDDPS